MARLPQVGGDVGNWGEVLNEFLAKSHNPDGTLKDLPINIKDFGAIGDGATDDSRKIQDALDAVPAGGATVFFPAGTYKYSSQLNINKADTNLVFQPGAKLLKDTSLSTEHSIRVRAANVTFVDMKQDGQRSAASHPTFGFFLTDEAKACKMIRCSIRSNKFHGIHVEPGAELDLYDCEVSDNVHSATAGYGVVGFGRLRTYGNCQFDNNGYAGIYTHSSTSNCVINGYMRKNGVMGAQLGGYKGTSEFLYGEDNGFNDVVLHHANGWHLGTVISVDAGKSAGQDGIGLEFYGSSFCKVGTLQVVRPRGFGLCFARRAEPNNVTMSSDSGGTISVSSTSGRPSAGAMVIENEYITYSGVSGNSFTGCARGQKGTASVTHSGGRDVYFMPSTKLTADPGGGATFAVASTAGFTSGGLLWLEDEIVTYSGKTATSFTGIKRGQFNTNATAHGSGVVVSVFLESHHNDVGVYEYDGYGHTDSDPAVQISGGSSFNQIHTATIRNAIVAVSIGEEPWPKSNDYNEVGLLYAENCPYSVFLVTGGNHNRIRQCSTLDCWTYDPTNIADALFYFDNARPNLAEYGFGTVIGNGVDSYEVRRTTAPAPANVFRQKNAARGNYASTKLTASANWDPPSMVDDGVASTTLTVAGAVIGDPVVAGFTSAVPAGAILSAQVTAPNTVTVSLLNRTGAGIDLVSGSVRVEVASRGSWG